MKKGKILFGLLIIFICFIIGNINVKAEEKIPFIAFKKSTVNYGDKIYVGIDIDDNLKKGKIYGFFSSVTDPSENNGMFSLELHDVNSDMPYFEPSSYMKIGHTYVMHSISLGNEMYVYPNNNYNKYFECNAGNQVSILAPLTIDRFEVSTPGKSVDIRGKIRFIVETSNMDAYDTDNISIMIRNINEPNITAYGYMNRISDNEYYFDLLKAQNSNKIIAGEYSVSDINIFPKDGGIALHFIADNYGGRERNLLIADSFKIVDSKSNSNNEKTNENKKSESFLKKIDIAKTTAKINEKVGVKLDTKNTLASATLIFSNDVESMTVTVKKLNSKDSYFVVPFTTNSGNYSLDFVVLKDVDGKEFQYRKGEDYFNIAHFDFNSTIVIDSTFKDGDSLSIDNSKMTAEILEKIKKLESNIKLDINADENPIITKELFETIKGSNKTIVIRYNDIEWTFNGLDVKNPKRIDVSTNLYKTSEDDAIKSKYNKGFVLNFADNDKLPGKCLIKLFNTEELNKVLKNNNINIYYFNEETGKFEIVKMDTKYNKNGFYEFYIDHNSKYVLTSEEIDTKYISNPEKAKKSINSLDLNTILIIGIPSILVIAFLIILIVRKSKKKKNIVANTVETNNMNE